MYKKVLAVFMVLVMCTSFVNLPAFADFSGMGGGQSKGAGGLRLPLPYYTEEKEENTGVYNDGPTEEYYVIDFDDNTWHNPVTNDYSTYTDITYNETENYYTIYDVEYTVQISYHYTNVVYYVQSNETESTWYYKIYYQLPDGRNTYNMTAEEVWGLGLSYDAVNYDIVTEDDGTLGLWHFDGNLNDESVHNSGLNWAVWSDVAYQFVDTSFTSGLYLSDDLSHILYMPSYSTPVTNWTIEGRVKFNVDEDILPASKTNVTEEITWNRADMSAPSYVCPFTGITRSFQGLDTHGAYEADVFYDYTYSVDNVGLGSLLYVGHTGTNYYYLPVTCDIEVTLFESQWSADGVGHTRYYFVPVYSDFRCCGIPVDSNFTFSIVNDGTNCKTFINGSLYSSVGSVSYSEALIYNNKSHYPDTATQTAAAFQAPTDGNFTVVWDELRLTNRALYSSTYVPSSQPFDTNKVYVLPETGEENQIAIKSNVPITMMRVGGVRPTYPSDGFLYVYCENGIVMDVQQYQTDGWYSVDAVMMRDGEWVNLKGLDITDITIEAPEDTGDDDGSGGSSGDGSGDSSGDDDDDSSGSGSGGGTGSQTGGFFGDVLDAVLSAVLNALLTVFSTLINVAFSLIGWSSEFLGFVNIDYLGGFFPAPVWALVCIFVPLVVVLAIVRFVRGFL